MDNYKKAAQIKIGDTSFTKLSDGFIQVVTKNGCVELVPEEIEALQSFITPALSNHEPSPSVVIGEETFEDDADNECERLLSEKPQKIINTGYYDDGYRSGFNDAIKWKYTPPNSTNVSAPKFTEQQVIDLLDSFKFKCALKTVEKELSPNAHFNRINAIHTKQFINDNKK